MLSVGAAAGATEEKKQPTAAQASTNGSSWRINDTAHAVALLYGPDVDACEHRHAPLRNLLALGKVLQSEYDARHLPSSPTPTPALAAALAAAAPAEPKYKGREQSGVSDAQFEAVSDIFPEVAWHPNSATALVAGLESSTGYDAAVVTSPLVLIADPRNAVAVRHLTARVRQEATEGNPHAINVLGWMMLRGIGERYADVSKELRQTDEWAQTSPAHYAALAAAGQPSLGPSGPARPNIIHSLRAHPNPFSPRRNARTAYPLFALAASLGCTSARINCCVLRMLRFPGTQQLPRPGTREQQREWFVDDTQSSRARLTENGTNASERLWGECPDAVNAWKDEDAKTAWRELRALCDTLTDHANATHLVAWCNASRIHYYGFRPFKEDPAKLWDFLNAEPLKAASATFPPLLRVMGYCYRTGFGKAADGATAFHLYRASAVCYDDVWAMSYIVTAKHPAKKEWIKSDARYDEQLVEPLDDPKQKMGWLQLQMASSKQLKLRERRVDASYHHEAGYWALKAAHAGDVLSASTLSCAFNNGDTGLTKRPAHAQLWRLRAALRGDSMAQHNLAVMYFTGIMTTATQRARAFGPEATYDVNDRTRYVTPKDWQRATLWWQRAAAQHYAPSMRVLALRCFKPPVEARGYDEQHDFKEWDGDRSRAYGGGLRADNDTSLRMWKRCIELDPNMSMARYDLGMAYLCGDYTESMRELEAKRKRDALSGALIAADPKNSFDTTEGLPQQHLLFAMEQFREAAACQRRPCIPAARHCERYASSTSAIIHRNTQVTEMDDFVRRCYTADEHGTPRVGIQRLNAPGSRPATPPAGAAGSAGTGANAAVAATAAAGAAAAHRTATAAGLHDSP